MTIQEKLKIIYKKCGSGNFMSLKSCAGYLYLKKKINIEEYKKMLALDRNSTKNKEILLINLLYQIVIK
jgi:hypothetical protein